MRRFTESDAATLKDIERAYGKDTARALAKYCALKKIDMTKVVSDMRTDGNGMTEWDKFDVWAKNTQRLDIMGNFDDTIDWTGASDDEKREKKEREIAKPMRMAKVSARRAKNRRKPRFSEGSGSRMDVWEISQWIADELNDCEWAHDVHFRNDDYEDPWFDFSTDEGDVFKVTVKKVK